MKLTKATVEKLAAPSSGYVIHWDDELPSFGCRVTASGAKSYVLQRRIKNRTSRITICRTNEKAPDWARDRARALIGQIVEGKDPVAEKRRDKLKGVTLATALESYFESRHKLKPRTVSDMRTVLNRLLGPWMKKPFTSITEDMVIRKHRELGEASKAQADLAFRYLRAVISFAAADFVDANGNPMLANNPVTKLSRKDLWFRVERRKTVLKPEQMPAWYAAVQNFPENVREYLIFLLLTGTRGGEAATLKWATVDLPSRAFTMLNTKNRRSHSLPMGDYLHAMITRRKVEASGEFVFYGLHRKGNIKSADSAIRIVVKASGVEFCRHDLRRAFASTAESLDISAYSVKRLLNHVNTADVTEGYITIDLERLRKPMQRIEDYLLAACGETKRFGALITLFG